MKNNHEIIPRLLTEKQAADYLNLSLTVLRKLRSETPKRFTDETFNKALENGIAPIPYLKIGAAVRYDVNLLDKWISKQQIIGELPNDLNSKGVNQ